MERQSAFVQDMITLFVAGLDTAFNVGSASELSRHSDQTYGSTVYFYAIHQRRDTIRYLDVDT
jgi:hypothetical protein